MASFPGAVRAQTWSWTVEDIDPAGGDSTALALDGDGNLHMSYRVPAGEILKYGFRPAGESKWFKMTLDHGLVAFVTGITVDASGNPYICYTPNVLNYARFDGHKWTKQQVDPGSGLVGYTCSIRVTHDGKPMISWYLPSGGFRYAILRDGTWLASGLDGSPTDYAGKWNSMDLDRAGNPHIAYSDFPHGQLRYAHHDGKGWIHTVLHSQNDDPGGPKGMGAALVLDAAGSPWISYYDEQALRVIHFENGKWKKQIVEKIPTFENWGWKQFHSNIVLDHAGNPHIVFESLQGLEHAWLDNGQWRVQTILAESGSSQFENSMVMSSDDTLYISYRDPVDHALKLAIGRPGRTPQTASKAAPAEAKP